MRVLWAVGKDDDVITANYLCFGGSPSIFIGYSFVLGLISSHRLRHTFRMSSCMLICERLIMFFYVMQATNANPSRFYQL